MRHFYALPALLRSAVFLASASQSTFSVQDDLLAFPQYEVRFMDEWTGEQSALAKLAKSEHLSNQHQPESDALRQDATSQLEQYQHQQDTTPGVNEMDGEQAGYEHMVLEGQQWICRIPKVKKPQSALGVNETLSKVEEEKELARATDRGWELLSGMKGNCVFFISGWWSYRFCYNQGVKQFHQLPPSRGVPAYPPVEDPGVPGFTLGTYEKRLEDNDVGKDEKWGDESALDRSSSSKRKRSNRGELVQRGESRYLVQRLGGGTVCDLTGKERKVEVQFHCNPQSADRISLIKETSTCAYLMVIQTPRLCNDVAFLPPQKDQPNPISCSPVLRKDEVEGYEQDLRAARSAEQNGKIWEANAEAAAALGGPTYEPVELPVGDIYVGEHRLIPEGQMIEKTAIVGGGKETYIDTVASSNGRVLSREDLEKLGLRDPKAVEELKKELEKIAQGQNWKLDVIDTPHGREYRGIIGDDEEEDSQNKKQPSHAKGTQNGKGKSKKKDESNEQEKSGSEEELFKEEL